MRKICVIGSLNMDLIMKVDRFPNIGETIRGEGFSTYPGGKGGNQAVASARLGTKVFMVGKVGDDVYGREYIENLKKEDIDISGVQIEKEATGIAMIEVDNRGNNKIITSPGANSLIDNKLIDEMIHIIRECDVVMLQLEVPLETIEYALNLLKKEEGDNQVIVLDPAPARALNKSILEKCDYITPNESEFEFLTGVVPVDINSIKQGAGILRKNGAQGIILKAGEKGAYYISKEEIIFEPAFKVNTIDTVAAGDSFNAGFVKGLIDGDSMKNCLRKGNATGGLSTTGEGAQVSMPYIKDIEELLKR